MLSKFENATLNSLKVAFSARKLSSHSLSFQPIHKYCGLTIFNSFNFTAYEFSVESFRMEILRVFASLAIACKTTYCKHIEDRLKKDGVFVVGKRRLFQKKRRVGAAKTKSFEPKDFVLFGKDAVFSEDVFFSLSEECYFCRKIAQNTKKFCRTAHFVFLSLY